VEHARPTTRRIKLARAVRPFINVADLARSARLDRRELLVLANALPSLTGGNQRTALWLWCCRPTAK